jgi:hypothetical protein
LRKATEKKSGRIKLSQQKGGVSSGKHALVSHSGGREGWLEDRVSSRAHEHGLGKEEEEVYESFVRFLSKFDDDAMAAVCKDVQSEVEEGRMLLGKFGGFEL